MAEREAKNWSNSELLDYSKEHLRYEITMFLSCAQLMQDPFAQMLVTPFQRNLIIEGLGIHLRGLLEFFCRSERNFPDDVLAVDYMGASSWPMPTLSKTAEEAWKRINKEIGHLTSSRKDADDASKSWANAIEVVVPEVAAICGEFVRLADPDKLAKEVREAVAKMTIVPAIVVRQASAAV
jgi:hypothetical protein